MDKIIVVRDSSQADWTTSKFYFDSTIKGYGIEDEKRNVKIKGESRIPEGTYAMDLRNSPKFSSSYYRDDTGNLILSTARTTPDLIKKYHTAHELVWVTNVPGFEYILWHWGNTDDDTDGCYIVGSSLGIIKNQSAVLQSRLKYTAIYPEIWRTIKEKQKSGSKLLVEYK